VHICAARNDDSTLMHIVYDPDVDVNKRVDCAARTCTVCPLRDTVPKSMTEDATDDDEYGRTALHMAAAYGCYRALRLLLSHEDIDLTLGSGKRQFTPLHLAARFNYYPCVRALLEDARCTSEVLNAVDSDGETPVMRAVRRASELAVFALCQRSDLDTLARSKHMELVVMQIAAMSKRRARCLRLLLRRPECNPGAPGRVSVCYMLSLRAGATVVGAQNDCTPLHAAVWANNQEAVMALLSHPRTDLNACNELGWTPLTMAMRGLAQIRALSTGGKQVKGLESRAVALDSAGDAADMDEEADDVPWISDAMAADDDATGSVVSGRSGSSGSRAGNPPGGAAGGPRSLASAASGAKSVASSVAAFKNLKKTLGTAVDDKTSSEELSGGAISIRLLCSDLRLDLLKREVKAWTPFRKNAMEVACKYHLSEVEMLLKWAIEARGLEAYRKGLVDPKLCAWMSARAFSAQAQISIMSCGVGVVKFCDLEDLATLSVERPEALTDMKLTALDRLRVEKELKEVYEDVVKGDAKEVRIFPKWWAEELAEIEASAAVAMEAAQARPRSASESEDEEERVDITKGLIPPASDEPGGGGRGGGSQEDEDGGASTSGGGDEAGQTDAESQLACAESSMDIALRELLAGHDILHAVAVALTSLAPPITTRVGFAGISDETLAGLLMPLDIDTGFRVRAALADARALPSHKSVPDGVTLHAFLEEKGLDREVWEPILRRLGARRPSHLASVRRAHLDGEVVPPLQREAFFRAIDSLQGSEASEARAKEESSRAAVAAAVAASSPPSTSGEAAQPTSLLGFVNYWLMQLYRDHPWLAISLIVIIILGIIAGIVTGSLSATDAFRGSEVNGVLRGSHFRMSD
jgi:hypothetical protein